MKLTNSYYELGKHFYQEINPSPVDHPELILWNDKLAQELSLPEDIIKNAADYFSGNKLFNGSTPIALAYAGHQFGGFSPQLGDGRAHLLGELTDNQGHLYELQLKGSGQTRYSRRGDGRCALKPAIREFIMSEAMHGLGIATSRSLSVVTTGETLYRGIAVPGAIVSRLASSHIRVGTFQYFAAKGDIESLQVLLDYAIDRHYPEIDFDPEINGSQRITRFLDAVIDNQVKTIVNWMRVGFIHGVMNTDNMTISGETIDYGPCAMMGVYSPDAVFSSIDEQGRYCYGNQPAITQWNLARLAECLIPLLDENTEKAVSQLEPLIIGFTEKYQNAYYAMMYAKLGIVYSDGADKVFIDQFLHLLEKNKLDYTDTFLQLTNIARGAVDNVLEAPLAEWLPRWKKQVTNGYHSEAIELMLANNPLVIPRNHHIEAVLTACEENTTNKSVEKFLQVLRSPYQLMEDTSQYQDLPIDGDIGYHTFCGT